MKRRAAKVRKYRSGAEAIRMGLWGSGPFNQHRRARGRQPVDRSLLPVDGVGAVRGIIGTDARPSLRSDSAPANHPAIQNISGLSQGRAGALRGLMALLQSVVRRGTGLESGARSCWQKYSCCAWKPICGMRVRLRPAAPLGLFRSICQSRRLRNKSKVSVG